jgi:hypothetical protein
VQIPPLRLQHYACGLWQGPLHLADPCTYVSQAAAQLRCAPFGRRCKRRCPLLSLLSHLCPLGRAGAGSPYMFAKLERQNGNPTEDSLSIHWRTQSSRDGIHTWSCARAATARVLPRLLVVQAKVNLEDGAHMCSRKHITAEAYRFYAPRCSQCLLRCSPCSSLPRRS